MPISRHMPGGCKALLIATHARSAIATYLIFSSHLFTFTDMS